MDPRPLRTADHVVTPFAPHGAVDIFPGPALIRYEVRGPFNIEAIQAFGNTVAKMLTGWTPIRPHVSITFWHDSMMASADALVAYSKLLHVGRRVIPREVANVWCAPPEIEGRIIMVPEWLKLYHGNDHTLEIVATREAAWARVAELLGADWRPEYRVG